MRSLQQLSHSNFYAAAAWECFDVTVGRWLGLDESKYAWAIREHHYQVNVAQQRNAVSQNGQSCMHRAMKRQQRFRRSRIFILATNAGPLPLTAVREANSSSGQHHNLLTEQYFEL